jgi:hypothetical protein
MQQLPPDIDIVNLSLGGYTDHDTPPMAMTAALAAMGQHRAVVAAAGNQGSSRPFWPAAFPRVLAVGAVEGGGSKWTAAGYSNQGAWVDATARGTNLQSTFAHAQTKVALGATTSPSDPTITFGGWASWSGTSFATPITAAMLARTMSRTGLGSAVDAQTELLISSPPVALPEFPHAVVVDELDGKADGTT